MAKRKETYWQFLERTAAEVAKWPAWKRGETSERVGADTEPRQKEGKP